MQPLQQILIGGYSGGGLTTDKKPLMIANEAFSTLENAYVWRDRVKKRDGSVPMGRLTRIFTTVSIGVSGASPWTFNLFARVSPAITETYAQLSVGTVVIRIGGITFTDQSNGTLTSITPGNSGTVNYTTGVIVITTTTGAGTAATASFIYFPGLPVMGICKRDVASLGIDQTIFFDTVYAYQYVGGFQELASSTPTTWTGTNTDFFWSCNFQGATADLRYFFATNNNINISAPSYDPIRYYNDTTWTALQPLLTSTITLWQALIIIPYYGRLICLNTWEGLTSATYTGATNFFARCRFSQLGDPTDQTNGWRTDIFGRGGFIDAPTNESIVSAAFFRNTLIVFFEYSTWQLRYIGEYGLPFIFERVSSDFGAVSTFSPIVFDQGVMAVSDRGIIQASANGLARLDEQIPETVFSFQIGNNSPNFVHGIRDFEKELVYWNYVDSSNLALYQAYPNTTLVFNYKNNTWATYRDTITCFGTVQFNFGITWDSLTTFWESTVYWDNVDDQQYVDYVGSGTQNGFINIYENPNAETPQPVDTLYAPTLFIEAINTSLSPAVFTIPSHNFANGEIIYITNALWLGTDPQINNQIYEVATLSANTISLRTWNENSKSYSDYTSPVVSTYIGGGIVALFPVMNIVGKDFNPYQDQGKQFKLSYIDFQLDSNQDSPGITALTIQLYVNSRTTEQANILYGNMELLNSPQACSFITFATQTNPCVITSPNYSLPTGTSIYIANVQGMTQLNSTTSLDNYIITVIDKDNFSLNGIDATGFTAYAKGGNWNTQPVDGQVYPYSVQYAWYRFYSNQYGQYLRVAITYDDSLMNQLSTHQLPMELNAMSLWMKPGARLVN